MTAVERLVVGIAMLCAGGVASPAGSGECVRVPVRVAAEPCVPQEERFVHIGGGFFSYFDSRTGSLAGTTGRAVGTIRLELESLRSESRFVYLLEGFITVRTDGRRSRTIAMECLDYVWLPGSNEPAYRLVGEGVVMIGIDKGVAPPCFLGELYLRTGNRYERYAVSILGRCESDAERHLWQRIERVTLR